MKTGEICSEKVDYSKVTGDRILPFVFTLNEEDSILNPKEGEHQRFCYDVEGVGEDTVRFADLKYFLLGICPNIMLDDILEVTVVIDGVPQKVILGENVQIKTEEHPDPHTGCSGIKFDFPLDKNDGKMQVCITLEQTYAIGPVNVCVFGDDTTATGLSICGPVCGGTTSCETTFFQKETVCVPVTVTPFAKSEGANARCCGNPVVTMQDKCPGTKKSCTFTVTQPLCIEITLAFGADIDTGDASVVCGDVSEEGCNCGETAQATAEETANNSFIRKRFL